MLAALGWMAVSARAAAYPDAHPAADADPAVTPDLSTLRSRDGAPFRLWVLRPPAPPRARLLLIHGYHADHRQVLALAARLRDQGYEAALFELRGHGGRPGPYTFGVRELDDADAVLAWGREQDGPRPLPAAVIGFSAGAALACQIAARHPEVQAVVLDSVSPRLRLAIRREVRLRYRLPPALLAWLTWWAVQARLRTRLARRDPLALAARLRQPALVIAGGADRRVDEAESRAFYERWAGPKTWWWDPAAGHVSLFAKDPAAYTARVAAFLDQALLG